jgi:hypothetical protein
MGRLALACRSGPAEEAAGWPAHAVGAQCDVIAQSTCTAAARWREWCSSSVTSRPTRSTQGASLIPWLATGHGSGTGHLPLG